MHDFLLQQVQGVQQDAMIEKNKYLGIMKLQVESWNACIDYEPKNQSIYDSISANIHVTPRTLDIIHKDL